MEGNGRKAARAGESGEGWKERRGWKRDRWWLERVAEKVTSGEDWRESARAGDDWRSSARTAEMVREQQRWRLEIEGAGDDGRAARMAVGESSEGWRERPEREARMAAGWMVARESS
uniref:Uncharacterized protein n=1 Tax=Micrurus lemniscatus lemniscatus TaxID=129467 RepID=A0A2D4I752_MICLE